MPNYNWNIIFRVTYLIGDQNNKIATINADSDKLAEQIGSSSLVNWKLAEE